MWLEFHGDLAKILRLVTCEEWLSQNLRACEPPTRAYPQTWGSPWFTLGGEVNPHDKQQEELRQKLEIYSTTGERFTDFV